MASKRKSAVVAKPDDPQDDVSTTASGLSGGGSSSAGSSALVAMPEAPAAVAAGKKGRKKAKKIVDCVFCGGTSEDGACWDCRDIAMRLRPGKEVKILVAIYTNEKGAHAEDTTFKAEFDGALKVRKSIGKDGPRFSPGSLVENQTAYGFEVFQDFGCVTESEYTALVGQAIFQSSVFAVLQGATAVLT
eukprot:gb/GFBE01063882.1/.p1 GENE.gb/GFBE01063882.1/~~gb/GFBE01063882.1/.p1  ORF type:complete len:189 (+),score=50.95 gb/GFBE01063882.1/:1-567(+)